MTRYYKRIAYDQPLKLNSVIFKYNAIVYVVN